MIFTTGRYKRYVKNAYFQYDFLVCRIVLTRAALLLLIFQLIGDLSVENV